MPTHLPDFDPASLTDEQLREALRALVPLQEEAHARGLATGHGPRFPRSVCPARTFDVASGVHALPTPRLDALTEAVRRWAHPSDGDGNGTSLRPDVARARSRVYLVYLLLRYTGAKLKEVLGLHLPADMTVTGVRFSDREVPLPLAAREAIRTELERPMHAGGADLAMDPGYFRKKLAEPVAEAVAQALSDAQPESKAEAEPVSPSVLRHSRAVELLRAGMPLPVVQQLLGQSSADLTAPLYNFDDETMQRLVEHTVQADTPAPTSARNVVRGTVAGVACGDVVCMVDVLAGVSGQNLGNGVELVALITAASRQRLGLREGRAVRAMVKAPLVQVLPPPPPAKSLDTDETDGENVLTVTISEVVVGEGYAEVRADGEAPPLCALLPEEAFDALGLGPGDAARFVFSPAAVVLTLD